MFMFIHLLIFFAWTSFLMDKFLLKDSQKSLVKFKFYNLLKNKVKYMLKNRFLFKQFFC